MKLDEMTSSELQAKIKKDSVVILPIGAVEEHGPHLPLATDSIQPLYVAERAAEKTGAFVAPLLAYGVCSVTKDYPGTVSLSFDSLRSVTGDILSELVRNGFRRIIVLSGHAGRDHMSALRIAAKEVVSREDVLISVLSDYDLIWDADVLPHDDGHGGLGETSRILAQRPRLVRKRPGNATNRIPKYAVLPDTKKYWSGYSGDPSKASAGLGRKLDRIVISKLMEIIADMKKGKVGK